MIGPTLVPLVADGDRADLAQRWPNGGVLSGNVQNPSLSDQAIIIRLHEHGFGSTKDR